VSRRVYSGFSFIHFVCGLVWMMFFSFSVWMVCCSWVCGMFSFVARRLGLCHFWSFRWLRRASSLSSLESEVNWCSPIELFSIVLFYCLGTCDRVFC